MKCLSCGAEISLTDSKCPYCGRVITETARHQEDLKNYKKKSGRIRGKAESINSQNVPLVISAVVMIILIVFVCVAAYVKENAFLFKDNALQRESLKKYDEYSAMIQDYLDAGDYTGFNAFMEYHNIAEYKEPYADLKLINDFAYDYNSMVSAIECAVMNGPDTSIYDPEGDVRSCRMQIDDFYREYEYQLSEIEADPYRDYIYDMRDKADMVLEVYLGLDEAGREEYFSSSDIKQAAYLEEVILGE
ncbi:MAG: zinc ribbon domain-containing protein [Lachnospiraceae bacterium]|nr:zinc ribbon domain-containing protein [Lachnospiraceae bacterium]